MLTRIQLARSVIIDFSVCHAVWLFSEASTAQTVAPAAATSTDPEQKRLAAEDAKEIQKLEKSIETLLDELEYEEAMPLAKQLVALRARAQGEDNWETAEARAFLLGLEKKLTLDPKQRAEVLATERQMKQAAHAAQERPLR